MKSEPIVLSARCRRSEVTAGEGAAIDAGSMATSDLGPYTIPARLPWRAVGSSLDLIEEIGARQVRTGS
ncbi:MAG: hypothetical protein ACLQJR_30820 [Stellaceae bacterium]